MDKTEHAIVGALTGLVTYRLHKLNENEAPTIQGALGFILLGGFAGVLPDILEPATSPNHRSFFHSAALLLMLAHVSQKAWESQNLTDVQKLVISAFTSAYGSHLLSDSLTPKSIPLVVGC